jgi:hypothetical protein
MTFAYIALAILVLALIWVILNGHPLVPGFELRAGALVVFVPKQLDNGGNLTFLLDAAREIARRVVREVEEESRPVPARETARGATGSGL